MAIHNRADIECNTYLLACFIGARTYMYRYRYQLVNGHNVHSITFFFIFTPLYHKFGRKLRLITIVEVDCKETKRDPYFLIFYITLLRVYIYNSL